MAKQLNDWLAAQPLERQAKILANADQIQASSRLAELRKQQAITQAQLAARMCVSQASISQLENQADVQLSTLMRYVRALGGQLRIEVDMPDGTHQSLTI